MNGRERGLTASHRSDSDGIDSGTVVTPVSEKDLRDGLLLEEELCIFGGNAVRSWRDH